MGANETDSGRGHRTCFPPVQMSIVRGEGSFRACPGPCTPFGLSEPQFPGTATRMRGADPPRRLQLRVNQDEPSNNEAGDGGAEDSGAEAQSSRDQMRTNVINEILSTERDYIKHLRDVCEVRPAARWRLGRGPEGI